MPGTAEPLSPIEQSALLGEITRTLVAGLPSGWSRLVMDYMAVGRQVSAGAGLKMADGSFRRHDPPRELAPLFRRLRRGMYVPDLGTWFSVGLIIDPPDVVNARFNHTDPPNFRKPIAPEQFITEHQRHPRNDAAMPEWFRTGLAASSAARERLEAIGGGPKTATRPKTDAT